MPVGWLWYLGTLVPVIGVVQVGFLATTDHYTYVPLIGLFLLLAWGAAFALLAALSSLAITPPKTQPASTEATRDPGYQSARS